MSDSTILAKPSETALETTRPTDAPAPQSDAGERRHRGPRFNTDLMGALEISRDLVCLTINGRITSINSAGLTLLGADEPQAVEFHRFLDFLVAEDEGAYDDGWLGRNAFRREPLPVKIMRLDGSIRSVELHTYRAREVAAGAVVVTGRDVTEASQLVTTVRRTEVRFRMLVENSIHLICHCRDDRIDYINHAGIRMLGYKDASDIVGRPVWDIFTPDYRAVFAENIDLLLQEQGRLPARLAHAGGERLDAHLCVTVFPSGESLEYMIEATDITAYNQAVTALRELNEGLENRVRDRTAELLEQRKLAEEQSRLADESRLFIESLLETVPSPLWFKDAEGRYRNYNRAFRDVMGIEGAGWIGRSLREVRSFELAKRHEEIDHLVVAQRDKCSYESAVHYSDGQDHDVLISKTAYFNGEGEIAGVIGMMVDITERKEMERELRRLATTDSLTGVYSRRHFMATAALELERSNRHHRPLSVLMLDIDHFKKINDTFGHAAGDDAIRAFTRASISELRDNDIMGRLGGEEFAILLPETPLSGAWEVAERLRQKIAHMVQECGEARLTITASIGVTEALPEDGSIETVLYRADLALYDAKHGGRNRVVTRL